MFNIPIFWKMIISGGSINFADKILNLNMDNSKA